MAKEQALLTTCKKMLVEGKPVEDVLGYLRTQGCSKTDSIIILTKAKGLSLTEAKRLVHFSNVWADVRDRDEEFHELLEQADRNKKS